MVFTLSKFEGLYVVKTEWWSDHVEFLVTHVTQEAFNTKERKKKKNLNFFQ